jgi:hypothetical protein
MTRRVPTGHRACVGLAARRIWSSRLGGIGFDLVAPLRGPAFQIGAVCTPLRWLDREGRGQPRAAFDETGKDTSSAPYRGRLENTLTSPISDPCGGLVCAARVAKRDVSECLSQNRPCVFGRRRTATPSHFNGEGARFMCQRTLGMLHNPSRLSAIRTRNKWTLRTKTQDAEVRFYKPFRKLWTMSALEVLHSERIRTLDGPLTFDWSCGLVAIGVGSLRPADSEDSF